MKLIDADALDQAMYHKSFKVDDGRQKWNSGLWIRYKIYEEASRESATVDAIPIEWIKKYMSRCLAIEQDAIGEMIKEWAERGEE